MKCLRQKNSVNNGLSSYLSFVVNIGIFWLIPNFLDNLEANLQFSWRVWPWTFLRAAGLFLIASVVFVCVLLTGPQIKICHTLVERKLWDAGPEKHQENWCLEKVFPRVFHNCIRAKEHYNVWLSTLFALLLSPVFFWAGGGGSFVLIALLLKRQ